MAKYVYPAVFTEEGNGFLVNFPDVPSCYTSGENMADALEMAEDVLNLVMCGIEDRNEAIPIPSKINSVNHNENEIVSLIACDTIAYRKLFSNKSVKKTLTIPAWLDTIAERNGANFSLILQNALKKEYNIE